MSVDVTVEQPIDRPREEVAAFAMDPANDREWIGALTDVNVVTEGPVGVGTRVERVAKFLGRRIAYVNEIVELVPGEKLAMKSVKSPFPMTVTYTFDEAPNGTRARIRATGDTLRLYSPMVRHGIRRDLRQLKARLEATR